MKRPGSDLALRADDTTAVQGGLVVATTVGLTLGTVALIGYVNGKWEERDAIREEQRSRR